MTDRAHLLRPVLDVQGNVLTGCSVALYEPGTTTPITDQVFLTNTTTTVTPMPHVFANGVISIYLDTPRRVTIGVTHGSNPEFFFEDIDVGAVGGAGFRAGTGTDTVIGGDINPARPVDAAGDEALVIGNSGIGNGGNNTALGTAADASGFGTTAVGHTARAQAIGATALGEQALATGPYSVVLTRGGQANGKYDIAIGYNTRTGVPAPSDINTIRNNIVIGAQATARKSDFTPTSRSIVIGGGAHTDEDDHGVIKVDQLEVVPSSTSGAPTTLALHDTVDGTKRVIGVTATGLTFDGQPYPAAGGGGGGGGAGVAGAAGYLACSGGPVPADQSPYPAVSNPNDFYSVGEVPHSVRNSTIALGAGTWLVTVSGSWDNFPWPAGNNGYAQAYVAGVGVLIKFDSDRDAHLTSLSFTGTAILSVDETGYDLLAGSSNFSGGTLTNLNMTFAYLTTGNATAYTLEGIAAGDISTSPSLIKPGLRVPRNSNAINIVGRLDTPPVGADMIVTVERWNNGAYANDVGTITIPDGVSLGVLDPISVACTKGDILKFNCSQVGSTTPGSDLLMSVDFA
jgi:hypothetical protein